MMLPLPITRRFVIRRLQTERVAKGCAISAFAVTALFTVPSASNGQPVDNDPRFEEVVVVSSTAPAPSDLAGGLFPEDRLSAADREMRERCMRIRLAGYACAPPGPRYVRYLLPGVSFAVGSSVLPDAMKQQLRGFAVVLRGRKPPSDAVRIDGHADATGHTEFNQALSVRRAEAARDFLIALGVDPALLSVHGFGSDALRNRQDPAAAENRRIEIARDLAR